jgi:PhoH-like ATPase
MGRDIGFLPGTAQEKLDPWMAPLKDALEFLIRRGHGEDIYSDLIDMNMLEIEPLTYIRGRSLPKTLFIVDEAQSLSRGEVKTIISRMGEDSKLILIGDTMQIDNPYLNSVNNGLSIAIEKFKEHDVAAHVTLKKGERSRLATIAAEIL